MHIFDSKNAMAERHSDSPVLQLPKLKTDITILLIGHDINKTYSFTSLLINLSQGTGPLDLKEKNYTDRRQGSDDGCTTPELQPVVISLPNGSLTILAAHCSVVHAGEIQGRQGHLSINEALKDRTSLDGILVLIDGRQDQLTPSDEYMLHALATIFPRHMNGNVGLLLTNCDEDNLGLGVKGLPPVFANLRNWTIQDPLSLSSSYHAQEGKKTDRERKRQIRKLEDVYEAAADASNEILDWIDKLQAQQINDVRGVYNQICKIEEQAESIIKAAINYKAQRHKLMDLRREHNGAKVPRHGITRKAEPERVDSKVTIKQAQVKQPRENLQQQEGHIAETRANLSGLIESIDELSLGIKYAEYIQSTLRALQYYKNQTSIHQPESLDAEIRRYEKYTKFLAFQESEEISLSLPGLIPMKSAPKCSPSNPDPSDPNEEAPKTGALHSAPGVLGPPVLGVPKSKKRLTILLVGETGCGKTAFMSLLVNLFHGYGPFELEDEHDEGAESGLSKQESQTTDATLYTVTLPGGIEIQILDTPGLADTRGIEQDEQHKAIINKAIQEFVVEIDAVLIMANGTTERMSAATNYTLSTLTSLFPNSIIENIAFIFTHCDSFTRNLDKASLPVTLMNSRQWTLENPLAYRKKYQRAAREGASESTLKEGRDRLETIYKKTVCTLDEWLIWVEGCQAQPTHQINRLYETMLNIEAQIESAVSLITRIGERRRAVQAAQHDLENHQTSKSAIQALCVETIEYWEHEDSDSRNTLCIAPGCYRNCHRKCGVPYTLDPVKLGRHCRVFRPENVSWVWNWLQSADQLNSRTCKGCAHKASDHRHYNSLYVKRTRPIHPTAKSDLAEAETKEQKLEISKKACQEELDRIQVELDAAQAKVNSLVDDYNAKSLSGDFAGHINSAIQMLNLRLKELESKFGTEHEQGVVRDAIQKFKNKLEVLGKSQGEKGGMFSGVTAGAKGAAKAALRWGKEYIQVRA
ncbi:hypothetical protein RHS03_06302, partial [Rhizoctonia solani]